MGLAIKIGGITLSSTGGIKTPLDPSALILTILSDTSIRLDWTSNSLNQEDGFSIEVSTDGIVYIEIDTVGKGIVTYDSSGLSENTTYYYRVRAFRGSKYSGYSNIENTTTWLHGEYVMRSGNTIVLLDHEDSSHIVKDVADLLSEWSDSFGSGRMEVATGGFRPLWRNTGVLYDGINQLSWSSVPWGLVQPTSIYMVMRQVTWVADQILMDGQGSSGLGQFYCPAGAGTPWTRVYAGAGSGLNIELTVNVFKIVRIFFNGASSKFQIMNTAAITGDFGANNMSGLVLGSNGTGTVRGNGEFARIAVRNIIDTAPNETSIYNYFAVKHGFPTI